MLRILVVTTFMGLVSITTYGRDVASPPRVGDILVLKNAYADHKSQHLFLPGTPVRVIEASFDKATKTETYVTETLGDKVKLNIVVKPCPGTANCWEAFPVFDGIYYPDYPIAK